MRQTTQVLDALDVALNTHAGVEPIKALDKPNNPRCWLSSKDGSGIGSLAGNVGNKHAVCGHSRVVISHGGRRALRWDSKLKGPLRAQCKRTVDLRQVVRGIDGMKSRLGLRMPLCCHRGGKKSLRDGD